MKRPARRATGPETSSIDTQAWAVVRAAAAHGLPGAPPIPMLDPGAPSWHRIIRLAEQQRVLGLLVAAVEQGDAGLELDDEVRRDLAQTHEAWCAHDLRLERALGQAADALEAAGIPYLVTKGPALAHRAYPDPSQRLFADLDLIVPSGHVHQATTTLAAALDAEAVVGELRPGFDERFGKETLLRTPVTPTTPVGLEIDLHRTPVAGALGLAIDLDELFAHPDALVLGGRRLPTPGPDASVVLAGYQASVADIPPTIGGSARPGPALPGAGRTRTWGGGRRRGGGADPGPALAGRGDAGGCRDRRLGRARPGSTRPRPGPGRHAGGLGVGLPPAAA